MHAKDGMMQYFYFALNDLRKIILIEVLEHSCNKSNLHLTLTLFLLVITLTYKYAVKFILVCKWSKEFWGKFVSSFCISLWGITWILLLINRYKIPFHGIVCKKSHQFVWQCKKQRLHTLQDCIIRDMLSIKTRTPLNCHFSATGTEIALKYSEYQNTFNVFSY